MGSHTIDSIVAHSDFNVHVVKAGKYTQQPGRGILHIHTLTRHLVTTKSLCVCVRVCVCACVSTVFVSVLIAAVVFTA